MKIPVRQQQTVLGSTQTAQARVPGPVAAAYSAAESRALAAAGQQMQQTGEVLFRLNEQQKKLNLAHFEATTQQMYKEYMTGLSAENDYQNFGQKYDDFEKSIDELGKSSLGEGEYDIWRQNAGNLFFRGAHVQMQGELAKTLNQYATLASQANTPEAFEIYRQQADLALQEAYAPQDGSMPYINQAQRDKMADDFTRQVGTATLMQDMQSDPDKALSNLQNPKMYSFFTPVERQKWIEDVKRVMYSAQGTGAEKKVSRYMDVFYAYLEEDPGRAQAEYQEMLYKPASFMQARHLTADEFNTIRSRAKEAIEVGPVGIENNARFDAFKAKYNGLGLNSQGFFGAEEERKKDGVVFVRPSMTKVMDLAIENERQINAGEYGSSHRNEAISLQYNLYRQIAEQITKKEGAGRVGVEGADISYPGLSLGHINIDTAESAMQNGLAQFVERQTLGELEPMEVGRIYFDIYKEAEKQNLNLTSVSSEDVERAQKIVRDVWNRDMRTLFPMVDPEKTGAVVSDGKLITFGEGKDPSAERLPNNWKDYKQEGDYLVRYDALGNEIDRVEHRMPRVSDFIKSNINPVELYKWAGKLND